MLEVSWADVAVSEMLTRFESCFDGIFLHSYPELKEHSRRLEMLPNIRKYIAERPRTAF
jgi:hypothetical protein